MSAAERWGPRGGAVPAAHRLRPLPGLRAAADLRPPPQPGRACSCSPRCRSSSPSAIKVSAPSRGGGGPDFFASITENGLFVALAALTIELGLFLPLAVATISGDAIAGEANIGTLRYLLTVPVQRGRGCWPSSTSRSCVFSFAATLVVAVTGIVVGPRPVRRRRHDPALRHADRLLRRAGRVLAAAAYLAVCFAALGAVGLFVSTLTEQPIGATVAVVLFSDRQLHPATRSRSWTGSTRS